MAKTGKNEKICSVCHKTIEREDAPILTMGHFGNPRLLCDDCEGLIETALKSREAEKCEEAMARLGEIISSNSIDDTAVTETVQEIFAEASDRAEKIKNGTYDFALDEEEKNDGLDEIPEELLETEEDKAATEKEEKANVKFNKIMDIVTGVVFAAAIVLIVIWFLRR